MTTNEHKGARLVAHHLGHALLSNDYNDSDNKYDNDKNKIKNNKITLEPSMSTKEPAS
jgi:hypothetical protein